MQLLLRTKLLLYRATVRGMAGVLFGLGWGVSSSMLGAAGAVDGGWVFFFDHRESRMRDL